MKSPTNQKIKLLYMTALMLISVNVISCPDRKAAKVNEIGVETIQNNLDEAAENSTKFKPIPVEKENGFYFAIDYNNNISGEDIKLEETPSLSSEDILEVKKVINENNNTPEIRIVFTPDGKIKLAQVTKNNIGKHLAIVIANQIVSIPLINCEIPGGVITLGDFSEKEIDKMVESLKNK